MKLTQDDLRKLSREEKRELALRSLREPGSVVVEGMERPRKGYVTIAAADGSVRQAHYTQARTEVYAPGSIRVDPNAGVVVGAVPIKQEVHHIDGAFSQKQYQPRTFNQRLDSMTRRLVDTWKQGKMTEAVLREIEGEYWKAGMPVTAERLRDIAARGLNRAQAEKERKAARMTTAPSWMVK